MATTYPEHEKLAAVSDKSQAAGEFVDWLLGEKHYTLGKYHEHTDACWLEGESHTERRRTCGVSDKILYPEAMNIRKLLAEFFSIDEAKLEEEKRTMLEDLRKKGGC